MAQLKGRVMAWAHLFACPGCLVKVHVEVCDWATSPS